MARRFEQKCRRNSGKTKFDLYELGIYCQSVKPRKEKS